MKVNTGLNKFGSIAIIWILCSLGSASAQVLSYENDYLFRAQIGDSIETAWINPSENVSMRFGFAYPVQVKDVLSAHRKSMKPSKIQNQQSVIPAFHSIYIKTFKQAENRRLCLFDQETTMFCVALKKQSQSSSQMKVVFERTG